MDFGLFPGARGTERNGRKRENQAQNLSGSAEGEVRKFPHEPSRTRGNTRDRPRKNPNSDELGFCIWWWIGDPKLNAVYEPLTKLDVCSCVLLTIAVL